MDETIRSIDVLAGLPYSEMTDAEIETLIEYKAQKKAQEKMFQEEREALDAHLQEQKEAFLEQSQRFENQLQELTQHALDLYKEVSNE